MRKVKSINIVGESKPISELEVGEIYKGVGSASGEQVLIFAGEKGYFVIYNNNGATHNLSDISEYQDFEKVTSRVRIEVD